MSTIDAGIPLNSHGGASVLGAAHDESAPKEQREVLLRNGVRTLIRPICKHDVALERRFIEALSAASRRFRFLDTIKSPSPALLKQLVDIDPSRDVALIALVVGEAGEQAIGVARLSAAPDRHNCEFAVTVSDEWQRKGLATHLMQQLIDSAIARGIKSMYSIDAAANDSMRAFADRLGMRRKTDPNDSTQVIHSIDLQTPDIVGV